MKKILILIGMVILSLTACTSQTAPQAMPTTQPPPTHTITPSTTPTITSSPEPTLIPSSTPLTGGTLNEEGPWLMYQHADNTMYFVNPDGTGRTKLPIEIQKYIYDGFNSTGDFMAMTTGRIVNNRGSSYLNIYKVPDMELLQSIDFYSYLVDHQLNENTVYDVRESFLWSPNGRYLAFTALIDGPSSDLYVYDTSTDQLKRLTWGEHQAGYLQWSPDSKWIVNEEYHGGRINYTYNMWASAPDGSENRWLYSPGNNQKFICWIDNCRFITLNRNMGPYSDPRVTNICTKESTILYDGWIAEDAIVDIKNRTIALQPVVDYAYSIGIHVMSIDEPYLRFVVDGYGFAFPDGFDEEQGYFITNGTCQDENGENGKLGFKYDGVLTCFHPTSHEYDIISPDQKWILTNQSKELCTYPDMDCVFSYGDNKFRAIWIPDSQGFFAYSRSNLYFISIDTLTPVLIDDQLGYSSSENSLHAPQWIGE